MKKARTSSTPETYQISITESAEKDLEILPRDVQKRIARKIDALAINPRPRGTEKLGDDTFRSRVGNYRIVYRVDDLHVVVLVVRVRHRRDVYRGRK